MKILLITAVKEFENEIKQLLKKSAVQFFSYQNVKGFKNNTDESVEFNWFGSEMNKTESVLFYAFIAKDKLDSIFKLVEQFNKKQESLSHIHVVVLAVEKSN